MAEFESDDKKVKIKLSNGRVIDLDVDEYIEIYKMCINLLGKTLHEKKNTRKR